MLQELQAYNNKGKSKKDEGPPCFWCWRWPLPSGGEDVKDVFEVCRYATFLRHVITVVLKLLVLQII